MQHFFFNSPRLVSFRGQKMHERRPDWSPLGVNFKILDEHPHLFVILESLPGSPTCAVCLSFVSFLALYELELSP